MNSEKTPNLKWETSAPRAAMRYGHSSHSYMLLCLVTGLRVGSWKFLTVFSVLYGLGQHLKIVHSEVSISTHSSANIFY